MTPTQLMDPLDPLALPGTQKIQALLSDPDRKVVTIVLSNWHPSAPPEDSVDSFDGIWDTHEEAGAVMIDFNLAEAEGDIVGVALLPWEALAFDAPAVASQRLRSPFVAVPYRLVRTNDDKLEPCPVAAIRITNHGDRQSYVSDGRSALTAAQLRHTGAVSMLKAITALSKHIDRALVHLELKIRKDQATDEG